MSDGGAALAWADAASDGSFTYPGQLPGSTVRPVGYKTVARSFNGSVETGRTETTTFKDYSQPDRTTVYASASEALTTLVYRDSDPASSFYGRPVKVVHADGQLTLYSYSRTSEYEQTVTDHGEPNAAGTAVTAGIRNTRRVAADGITLYNFNSDIASGLTPIGEGQMEVQSRDLHGRPTAIKTNFGSITRGFGCCGMEWEIDLNGVRTDYMYDSATKRLIAETRDGVTTHYTYDAAGNLTAVTVQGRSEGEITTSMAYDLTGNLVSATDPAGNLTLYQEHGDKVVYPDGTFARNVVENGLPVGVAGTAVNPVSYEFGPNWVKALPAGVTVRTDWLGRETAVEFADNTSRQSFYNAQGRLARNVSPGGQVTLYAYDGQGRVTASALDINQNGAIDAADLVDEFSYAYSYQASWPILETAVTRRHLNQSHELSRTVTYLTRRNSKRYRADGLLQEWRYTGGTGGAHTETHFLPEGGRVANSFQNDRLISQEYSFMLPDAVRGPEIHYGYDEFNRLVSVDGFGGSQENNPYAETLAYDALGRLTARTVMGRTTSYQYDNMGRLTRQTLPGGREQHFTYYPNGALKSVYGDDAYRREYGYDQMGRLTSLTTFRDDSAPGDTTRWSYDGVGNLVAKTYADGTSVQYAYDQDGRLTGRTWARGVTAFYAYDDFGGLSGVAYSDGTPSLTYQNSYLGQLLSVADGVGLHEFTYASDTLLQTSATIPQLPEASYAYDYDYRHRLTGLTLNRSATPEWQRGLDYEEWGRLSQQTHGSEQIDIAYRAHQALPTRVTLKSGTATRLQRNYTYDSYYRLTGITTPAPAGKFGSLTYTWNDRDQVTRVAHAGVGRWDYQYDSKGQVTAGTRYDTDGKALPGRGYGYGYDGIGNRTHVEQGMEALSHTYSANAVNQYILENIAGVVPVVGEADPAAEVTAIQGEDSVNYPPQFGMKSERDGKYFFGFFRVDNTWEEAEHHYKVYAVKADSENADRYLATKKEGSYTVPQALQPFTYAADGNTLTWRGWTYVWDAENRLTSITKGDLTLEFTYDFSSRRVSKKVTRAETVESHTTFIYDGYKLVEERDALNSNALIRRYHWNVVGDIPGSVYDAGLDTTYYYLTDYNKNVLRLIDASGNRVATYDYSPFGEQLEATGDYASLNPFRFSSEYFDNETGLVYYNYRYYNPATGRWLSREPLEEEGSLNLYSLVSNNPVNDWDYLGLWEMSEADLRRRAAQEAAHNGHQIPSSEPPSPTFSSPKARDAHKALIRAELQHYTYLPYGGYMAGNRLMMAAFMDDRKTLDVFNEAQAEACLARYQQSSLYEYMSYYDMFKGTYDPATAMLLASSIAFNPFKGIGEAIYGESLNFDSFGTQLTTGQRIFSGATSAAEVIGWAAFTNALLGTRPVPLKSSQISNATGIGGKTEVVERWMSRAELEATQQTGLLRGGRAGEHYVTDCANVDALRARQRLALDHTPEVRVQLEVPKGVFPPATRVPPDYHMPGGGMERMVKDIDIPVKILKVYD